LLILIVYDTKAIENVLLNTLIVILARIVNIFAHNAALRFTIDDLHFIKL